MKKRNIKSLISIFSAMIMCIVFFTAGIFFVSNSKAEYNIGVDESNGVSIYVNGEYVVDNGDGTYSVTQQSDVTIVAANEYKVLTKLIINDGTKDTVVEGKNFHTLSNVSPTSKFDIRVESSAATVSDKGNLFANPYLIADGLDLHALGEIYEFDSTTDTVTDELKGCFMRFFKEITDETTFNKEDAIRFQNDIYGKYFRVAEDIMVDEHEFYGIGNAEHPFVGYFDFLNHSVIVNISDSEYTKMFNAENEFCIGLFGHISSSATSPSVIRNAEVRGSISLSGDNNGGKGAIINAGGFAGKVSGNVVLRNITSGSSVSINDDCNVNVGGLFGILETPIENGANISYTGSNTSLNVNTNEKGAYINAGFLCGLLNNVYCNSFNCSTTSVMIVANATNEVTGNCNAAGIIGKILNTADGKYKELIITNVDVLLVGDFVVSATINNSGAGASASTYANAAGVYGNVECATSKTIKISRVYTGKLGTLERDKAIISIVASNTSKDSVGNVYASGLYGYIDDDSVQGVYLTNRFKPREYIVFYGNTEIKAIQQGTSQAYAGGIFAYNSYHFPTNSLSGDGYTIMYLNSEKDRLDIQAIQTSTSTTKDESKYQEATCAGFYSSKLPKNWSISNYELNVYNGHVVAQREVGSTAYGSVHAGGFVGFAEADNTAANRLTNIRLNLRDCSIEALNSSYETKSAPESLRNDSKYGHSLYNIAAGGFIGHLKNYGTDNLNFSSNTTSNYPGIDNVEINFSITEFKRESPVIRCVQNADLSNGSGDNFSEGYAGGLVGYLDHSFIKNSSVSYSGKEKAVITVQGNNKPNTTAVGGLVGETYLGANSGIENCYVENMRIYGTAYYYRNDNINNGDQYDIYVGGIIGVAGYDDSGSKVLIKDCFIKNTRVEAFGERIMLPYAGGIAGGMWWGGEKSRTQRGKIYNCSVIDSTVYAKSGMFDAYAGGVTGLLQNGIIDTCNVIKSYVRATTNSSADAGKKALSAGIVSRLRNDYSKILNCISNANVTADGENIVKSGISIAGADSNKLNECKNNFYSPLRIGHDNGEDISNLRGAVNRAGTIQNANSDCHPIVLGTTSDNKLYDYVTLGGNAKSFAPYKLVNTYNNETTNVDISMDLSNDTYGSLVYDEKEKVTKFVLKDNLTSSGSVFVNLYITVNSISKSEKYLLSSLPVFVNNDTEEPMYTVKNFDTDTALVDLKAKGITDEEYLSNSYYYYLENSAKNYEYVMINADTDKTLQTVKIDFGTTDQLKRYSFYSIRDVDNLNPTINDGGALSSIYNDNFDIKNYNFGANNDHSFDWIVNKITNGTAADGVNTDIDDEIMYFDISNYIKVTAVDYINNRVICVFKFDYKVNNTDTSKYVIIDCIPNYVTGIEIVVSSDTADLGHATINNEKYHIFAPGDTGILTILENHRDGRKYGFNKSSGFNQMSQNGIGITTNGHMVIDSASADGSKATVTAYYAGSCNIHPVTNQTFNVLVKNSITLSSNLTGCILDSSRKIARDTDFTFVLTPNHGYGFNPDSLIVKINDKDYNLTNEIKALDSTTNGKDDSGSITFTEGNTTHTFTYKYEAITGTYTVTIPSSLLGTSTNSISIEAEFPIIYKLVFDLGPSYEYYNERYVVYTIKENTALDSVLLNQIKTEGRLYVQRFGFNLEGYYLTDNGSKIESYGDSFGKLCESNSKILGTLSFYARWTYEVAIEKPDGIHVKSTQPLGYLKPSENGNYQLIPIDTQNDFSFYFDKDSDFAGSPEFRVYIVTFDGSVYSYNDVTTQCVYNSDEDSYSLSNSLINGLIFIKINTTSMSFNQGVTDATVSLDKKVYSDNSFTLSYAINYNENGVSKDKAAVTNGITFDFSNDLPTGTTLELYRTVNSTPLDIGRLVITTPKKQVNISEFIDISLTGNVKIGSALTDSKYNIIDTELYYIVVTPPAYNNDIVGNCSVTVTPRFDDPDEVNKIFYGDDAKNFLNQTASRPTYDFGTIDYNVYSGKTLSVTQNENVLSLTVNDSANLSDVVENRHKGTTLLWCVEAPNGKLYNLDDSAYKSSIVCTTDTAHYFLATSGVTFDIGFVEAGYKIKLIETKDVINPAVKPVVINEITK